MDPLPESLEVLRRLEAETGEPLVEPMRHVAQTLTAIVPSCIGFSLSYVQQGVAVTFLSSGDDVSVLDAIQYAAGGPCLDAMDTGGRVRLDDLDDPLDEKLWQLFGQTAAAHGVRSTLSFPLHEGADVIGGVNLYASDPHAFVDSADEVATLFGAWAREAVHNADLAWRTRLDSERGVERLDAASLIERAVGVLQVSERLDVDTARERIQSAAVRAGITPIEVAKALLALQDMPPDF